MTLAMGCHWEKECFQDCPAAVYAGRGRHLDPEEGDFECAVKDGTLVHAIRR